MDQYKKDNGEAALNARLASAGFSSVSAYLDYLVSEEFKNVTNNYAFSGDAKALFLDEALPANNGSNELTEQTYYGTTLNDENKRVKDTTKTYVFTATGCTYTYTENGNNSSQTYIYAYDSDAKKVYLKNPTTDRETRYTQMSGGPDYFTSADEYKAAQVNAQYKYVRPYTYNTTEKTLR